MTERRYKEDLDVGKPPNIVRPVTPPADALGAIADHRSRIVVGKYLKLATRSTRPPDRSTA
jgi:hypothetical protein